MVTLPDSPAAVQSESIVFDDRPVLVDDDEAPTAEDMAWLAGSAACENEGRRKPPRRLKGALRAAWLAGWDDENADLVRAEENGREWGRRALPDCADSYYTPAYTARWRKGYAVGMAEHMAEVDATVEGFKAGETFALRLAPSHLSAELAETWLRCYDRGRQVVEQEAADDFEARCDAVPEPKIDPELLGSWDF